MQLLFGIIMSPIRKSVKCVEAASPCGIDGASGPASSSSSTAKNNRIRKSSVTHCSNVVGFVGRDIRNKDPVASASDVSMVDPVCLIHCHLRLLLKTLLLLFSQLMVTRGCSYLLWPFTPF
ncbi:uncharacterized protein [Rutidosis leptorrhynchoides]|uniref:uncharacterized protein isoform X2 n=1 Tax=Rutidosis leptorrhynchoides TaxID=125765 RepID=UPI003A994330